LCRSSLLAVRSVSRTLDHLPTPISRIRKCVAIARHRVFGRLLARIGDLSGVDGGVMELFSKPFQAIVRDSHP